MDDEDEEVVEVRRGHADSDVTMDEWHAADTFLYVPDLSAMSGWSRFWINRRNAPQEPEDRKLGFRR